MTAAWRCFFLFLFCSTRFAQVEGYRDLPLDTTHGPYPVHLHIHGTAAFRSASAHQFTHMASRGFIVVAADHPGITLKDMMRLGDGQQVDQAGDARRTIAELEQLTDPQLQFLRGYINITDLAISGHSAGGGALTNLGDKAQVLMPWASRGANDGPALKSVLVMGGEQDGIASYSGQVTGYERSPVPKRLVGVERAGHLWCTDLCWIGEEDGGIVQIALEYVSPPVCTPSLRSDVHGFIKFARARANDLKVCGHWVEWGGGGERAVSHGIYIALLFQRLGTDGCGPTNVKNADAWRITNYAISAAQEAILMCDSSMNDRLAEIETALPYIHEYREQFA